MDLPDECHAHIYSFLLPWDLARSARVCRGWRDAAGPREIKAAWRNAPANARHLRLYDLARAPGPESAERFALLYDPAAPIQWDRIFLASAETEAMLAKLAVVAPGLAASDFHVQCAHQRRFLSLEVMLKAEAPVWKLEDALERVGGDRYRLLELMLQYGFRKIPCSCHADARALALCRRAGLEAGEVSGELWKQLNTPRRKSLAELLCVIPGIYVALDALYAFLSFNKKQAVRSAAVGLAFMGVFKLLGWILDTQRTRRIRSALLALA